MFLRWLRQLVRGAANSSRPGQMSVRYQHGFRPQLEELEDRRVLSSLQPAVINYPSGPVRATVSVTSIPSGPYIPNSPERSVHPEWSGPGA